MCFTNYKNQESAKVAENDIECYKYLLNDNRGLISPIYGDFIWKEKEIVEAVYFSSTGDRIIEGGFHSRKTIGGAQDFKEEMCDLASPIHKFIIPKGALYFENETEYVSNKIYLASEIPVEESVLTP